MVFFPRFINSNGTAWNIFLDLLSMLKSSRGGAVFILGFWLCIGLVFSPEDNGGSGLVLAFNIITWAVLSLTLVWLSVTLPSFCNLNTIKWQFVLGPLLWALPIIWAPSLTDMYSALPRILAFLFGILTLYWLGLLRGSNNRHTWLTVIWLAAVAQGAYGLYQIAVLLELRPMGIFYQPNLLASMSATGIACLLYQRWISIHKKRNLLFKTLSFSALVFLPFILTLTQSRTGWLGAIISVILMASISFKFGKKVIKQQLIDLALIIFGVLFALWWQNGLLIISKVDSNVSRWLIIRTTVHLIEHKPFWGWGYGAFERNFGDQLMKDNAGHGIPLIHPHNELLFAWVEGGIVAVAGIIITIAGIMRGLWERGGARWGGLALLSPLAVHINLEYPLYQSTPHFLVLILIISITITPVKIKSSGPIIRKVEFSLRKITMTLSISLFIFMLGALQTQRQIISIERKGMMPLALNKEFIIDKMWNPLALSSRLDYDINMALLIRYNLTQDKKLLLQFDKWAEQYLLRHADTNVAAIRLIITKAVNASMYPSLCQQLNRRYPDDLRFTCPELNSNTEVY